MKGNIQIISVVLNFDIYDETVRKNPFMKKYNLHYYDNRKENMGIPSRFNDFIRNHMERDSWLIFCHQDFGFLEDPSPKLKNLSKDFIYGPIGASRRHGIFFGSFNIFFTKKTIVGQINQAGKNNDFYKSGKFLNKPRVVDTVDCCCMIVHDSLIRKYDLRFDERLTFHLYSEDFSLNAKYYHKIKTKAVQFYCKHLRPCYDAPQEFYESMEYVKSKYRGKTFLGTCND